VVSSTSTSGAVKARADQAPVILVVDDDRRLRFIVSQVLERAGYTVIEATDGGDVVPIGLKSEVQLVVLDLNMPGISGLAALRSLRAARQDIGVIVLTGSHEESDLVEALATGADDYVTKPFQSRELLARVGAVLRRVRGAAPPVGDNEQVQVGGVTLDTMKRSVSVDGRECTLTRTECEILSVLMLHPGQVFEPADLLRRVWGPESADQPDLLRTNVYRLRQKLETDPRHPHHLRTRSGGGYFFAESAR
jgi:two-component system response regulator RegX3